MKNQFKILIHSLVIGIFVLTLNLKCFEKNKKDANSIIMPLALIGMLSAFQSEVPYATCEDAKTLVKGVPIEDEISEYTVKFYKYTADADGQMQFTTSSSSTGTSAQRCIIPFKENMMIDTESSVDTVYSESYLDSCSTTAYVTNTQGSYRCVAVLGISSGKYSIVASDYSSNGYGNSSYYDSYPSPAQAELLTEGEAKTISLSDSSYYGAYYKFVVPANKTAMIEVQNNYDTYLDVEKTDINGNVDYNYNYYVSSNKNLEWAYTANSTDYDLYIYVNRWLSSKSGSFTIKITTYTSFEVSNFISGGLSNNMAGLRIDSSNNFYLINESKIQKYDSSGTLVDTFGNDNWGDAIGTKAQIRLRYPQEIAVDSNGKIYTTEDFSCKVKMIDPNKSVTDPTYAIYITGGGCGNNGTETVNGSSAKFSYPKGIAVDNNFIYVADNYNHSIRKISKTPPYSTSLMAGAGTSNSGNSDGIGTEARFYYPRGLAVNSNYLYVADSYNNKIRRIQLSNNEVTTITDIYSPKWITLDNSGNLYITQSYSIHKYLTNGNHLIVAGRSYGDQIGYGTNAKFNNLTGIAIDSLGVLFVVDNGNARIKKITQE
ncbi:MAG: hypothetical protein H7A23_03080 [Leptospiraceae bacterium]|nr:hypothetical protein [Leptospiraceae bacterium]MCP5493513.1 hypothetical protein [Leptospiraceae bacterium]